MPNGKTHRVVGTAAGAFVAGASSRQEGGASTLLVILGGGVGGYISATGWTFLEPATSPRHRPFAHSCLAGGSALRCAMKAIPEWEAHWRRVAMEARSRRTNPNRSPLEHAVLLGIQLMAWTLVGLLAGLAAGYVSRLVLDSLTPASLPLLGSSAGPAREVDLTPTRKLLIGSPHWTISATGSSVKLRKQAFSKDSAVVQRIPSDSMTMTPAGAVAAALASVLATATASTGTGTSEAGR